MRILAALVCLASLILLAGCADRGQKLDPQPASGDQSAGAPEYSPGDLLRIGKAYNARGESEKAIEVLRQTLGARPDLAEALFELGLALSRLQRRGEAIAALDRAHELRAQRAGPPPPSKSPAHTRGH